MAAPAPTPTPFLRPGGRRRALLIGNAAYQDDRLRRLAVPARDVQDFARVLQDPAIGGFHDLTTLLDADKARIEPAVEEFCTTAGLDDLLLVYFSGHGLLDGPGDLYLALTNTRTDRPLSSALAADWLRKALNLANLKGACRQVLILDCCHSGAFVRAGAKGNPIGQPVATAASFDVAGTGRVVLMSSTATQLSWEGTAVHGAEGIECSLFTHFLVAGLRTGAAAPDCPAISVDDLYQYAHAQVRQRQPTQTPQIWFDGPRTGALILARNPQPPPPPKARPPGRAPWWLLSAGLLALFVAVMVWLAQAPKPPRIVDPRSGS